MALPLAWQMFWLPEAKMVLMDQTFLALQQEINYHSYQVLLIKRYQVVFKKHIIFWTPVLNYTLSLEWVTYLIRHTQPEDIPFRGLCPATISTPHRPHGFLKCDSSIQTSSLRWTNTKPSKRGYRHDNICSDKNCFLPWR